MLRFHLITVGRLDAPYLREGAETYVQRLRPYARVEWTQLQDEAVPARPSPADRRRIQTVEGERIQAASARLSGNVYTVALARDGQTMTSADLARHLADVTVGGYSTIAWLIGGSVGLAPVITKGAHLVLSLSTFTFPHQMVPLLLLEQIFRVCRIQRGEPYHHGPA